MKLISGLDRSQLSETEAFSYSTSSKHSLALEWLLVPLQSRKDLPTISPAPFQIKGNLFGKKDLSSLGPSCHPAQAHLLSLHVLTTCALQAELLQDGEFNLWLPNTGLEPIKCTRTQCALRGWNSG
jgi:hypothetical protein